MDKLKVSWQEVDLMLDEIADRVNGSVLSLHHIDSVYGIPRGGLVVAVCLSHKLDVQLITEKEEIKMTTLVVDDICDTGQTLNRFKLNSIPHTLRKIPFATLFYRPNKTFCPSAWIVNAGDKFIVFPWETMETAKVDYEEPRKYAGEGESQMCWVK